MTTVASKSNPLALVGQCKRHVRRSEIKELAEKKHANGITYLDLMDAGLVRSKEQGQRVLKRYLRIGELFTIGDHRPQVYYAKSLEAEIRKAKLGKSNPLNHKEGTNSALFDAMDNQIANYLESTVLPKLRTAPLYIHALQLQLTLTKEVYVMLDLSMDRSNGSKKYEAVVGTYHVKYLIYPTGTLMVYVQSSNRPLKMESSMDHTRFIAFLGQVRHELICLLMDRHERIVADVMTWRVIHIEINKDIKVNHSLLLAPAVMQIKHLDHLFRIYIKAMGKDTVCRVEYSPKTNGKTITEVLEETFTIEGLNRRLATIEQKTGMTS